MDSSNSLSKVKEIEVGELGLESRPMISTIHGSNIVFCFLSWKVRILVITEFRHFVIFFLNNIVY